MDREFLDQRQTQSCLLTAIIYSSTLAGGQGFLSTLTAYCFAGLGRSELFIW